MTTLHLTAALMATVALLQIGKIEIRPHILADLKRKRLFLLAMLLDILGFDKVPLPQNNTYVNYFAHLLTKAQIKVLNKKICAPENRTSAQLPVVLVNQLPAEYTIEDHATLLGRMWKVGNKDKGLVYVLSVNERKQQFIK